MTAPRKTPEQLRSTRWFGPDDLRSFGHRSRTKQMGYAQEDFAGKPVIGILNTWSDLNTCHTHFRERAEEVKRGVWQAGGFPVEMPAHVAQRAVHEADARCSIATCWRWRRRSCCAPPDRRRGADGRLRQDHAGPADGRDSA